MAVAELSGRSLEDLVRLDGRSAVVTGGGRGIGFAISKRLAEAGAKVYIGDLDEASAKTAAKELTGLGYEVEGVRLDATHVHEIEAVADLVMREFGHLDVWVNNAGIYPMAPAMDMDESMWDRVLDLNLKGTFYGAQVAAKRMASTDTKGVIINLASTAGFRGTPNATHYVASKHGVRGLTRSLAAEFGPLGIRVLALAPTVIDTPGMAEAKPAFQELGIDNIIDAMVATLPLGRAGVPDDVARVALFCASDLSMFMTGSTLPVDGGALAI